MVGLGETKFKYKAAVMRCVARTGVDPEWLVRTIRVRSNGEDIGRVKCTGSPAERSVIENCTVERD